MHVMFLELSLFDCSIPHRGLVVAVHLVVFELTHEMVLGCDVPTVTVQCIIIAQLTIIKNIGLVLIVISTDSSNLSVVVIAFNFNDFFNGRYSEVLAKLELVFFDQFFYVYPLLL